MITLDRCPVCDGAQHELVAEYNGLIAHDEMRATDLCRYDYRLCHGCGTTFASRRPTGDEYDLLYSRFNEMLGRASLNLPLETGGPVTAATEAQIAARPYWWQLSRTPPTTLATAMRKEVNNQTAHLAPLVSLKVFGMRVLEIRSKMGFLSSYLTRVLGAREACVMTTWPTQKAVVEQLYGLPCVAGADKEQLSIPFDGPFDLVIAPHVYIHAADPHQFFDEIHRVLGVGGHLYLCQEPDDTRLFEKGKNLFSELKCFHFQNIDPPSQAAALQNHGFRILGQGYRGVNRTSAQMWTLGRLHKKAKVEPIGKDALNNRLAMYRRWRDESILALPDHLSAVFSVCRKSPSARLLAVMPRTGTATSGPRAKYMSLTKTDTQSRMPQWPQRDSFSRCLSPSAAHGGPFVDRNSNRCRDVAASLFLACAASFRGVCRMAVLQRKAGEARQESRESDRTTAPLARCSPRATGGLQHPAS